MATVAAPIADEFVESCNPDGCANCSRLGHYCAARGITIDCAVIVETDGFDATDRPAAGTECVGCRHLGHYCPAKGMCGEQALCLACGTGESCDQVKSIEKMRSGFGDQFEVEQGYSIPECRTIEIADADRVVMETVPVTAWAMKASLDPENLKKGLRSSDRAPLRPPTLRFSKVARPLSSAEISRKHREKKKQTKETVMTTETKKTRKPTPDLGNITFAAVAPSEVPESKWGKGVKSPFQPIYDKMFEAFAAGQALRLDDLESADVAATIGKAAQARGKKQGIKVRTAVEGSTVWLLAVKREGETAAAS